MTPQKSEFWQFLRPLRPKCIYNRFCSIKSKAKSTRGSAMDAKRSGCYLIWGQTSTNWNNDRFWQALLIGNDLTWSRWCCLARASELLPLHHTIRGGRPSAYYLYIFGMTSKTPPKASNILATPIENVEDSRAQRLQRQQSRFRDRGGRVSSPWQKFYFKKDTKTCIF